MSGVSVSPRAGDAGASAEVGPLVLVVGSDLDEVADVAGDLEAWGHDPIVHLDADGAPAAISRVRPDVVVVVGESAASIARLAASAGDARLIAYAGEALAATSIPAGVGVASSPAALRDLVERVAGHGAHAASPEPDDRGRPEPAGIDLALPARREGVAPRATGGPAGWVRVLVASAILVIVASLVFAPPSEELEVTDDAPPGMEVVEEEEAAIEVGALGIPTVAPEAAMAVTPPARAGEGRSGFGGVVVLRDGGAPVADARVVVSGPSGTLEARTDADGRWRVADVRGGRYAVAADAPGLEGAPLQVLVGEGQVINGVRVVLGGGGGPG